MSMNEDLDGAPLSKIKVNGISLKERRLIRLNTGLRSDEEEDDEEASSAKTSALQTSVDSEEIETSLDDSVSKKSSKQEDDLDK